MRRVVTSPAAPAAIGPYSQAVAAAGFVFAAGQIGLDPQTGELVEGGTAAEARRALANVGAVLVAAGATWDDVVKAHIYLTDLGDFAAVNDVYASFVGKAPPARTAVQVAALPKGARVEIDVIAYVGENDT